MTNTHGGVPIKTKSSLLCLAASPVLHRNDNSPRIFSCEDTKEKKKRTLNAFEYSFLSYLVLFCFFPLGECRKMCGALTKSLFFLLNNLTRGNSASSDDYDELGFSLRIPCWLYSRTRPVSQVWVMCSVGSFSP